MACGIGRYGRRAGTGRAAPGPLALALVLFLLAACLSGRDPETAEAESPFDDGPGIAYQTAITGADEAGLAEVLERSSHLVTLADRKPHSLGALRRRAREDEQRLESALQSQGFYDGTVAARVVEADGAAKVTVEVVPGVVYLLGDYQVAFDGPPPDPAVVPDLAALGLHIGMRADAARIVQAEKDLVRALTENGYPWARVAERHVELDRDQTLVLVRLTVAADRRATFGPVTVSGLTRVDPGHVRRLVPWKQGETYSAKRVEDFRRALNDTGLFGSVAVTAQRPPRGGDRAPMTLELTERAHRSVGAGVNYSTTEGPGAKVFWEHRNFLGAGEKLRLTAQGNTVEQTLAAEFRKPAFVHRNQDLLSRVEVTHEDAPAYEQFGLGARLGLERRTGPWRTAVSGTVEAARVTDDSGRRLNRLFGLPIEMGYDNTDSLLDPTRGGRFTVTATPYAGTSDQPLLFTVLDATGSYHYPIDSAGRFVAAARARLGTIIGEDRKDVPANKRFYAGGGGSIRGYEYQQVGPLDNDGEPEGGLSLIEVGAELRARVVGDFGVVGFVDGGQALAKRFDSSPGNLQWAAGVGLRYHTIVGPLRFDIAFPLNGRRGVDEDYQFYISLGQAF
ncbi:MAG: outer membrane protein assembly factor [Hyphomicrobiales bacterium]|nr:outer membrane protein assembly factor [Hyphomicrobiales bacterium]MCP5371703.1 outer membrane protein assembly factor [Hyphomicrobiales bacterium]